MNNLYKKLTTESQHIRLTADEKRAMRAHIFGAPSPVTVTHSPYVFFASHRFLAALAAFVIVVFTGGSTAAFAAQGALPGEALYVLKTKVLEPVEVALAPTPQGKAKVETRIATRRVAEAQTLAAQGRLDATTTQEIEDNFNEHAERAIALSGGEVAVATLAVITVDVPAPAAEPQVQETPTARSAATLKVSTMLAVDDVSTSSPSVENSDPETEAFIAPEATSTSGKESTKEKTGQEVHEDADIAVSISVQREILRELKLKTFKERRDRGDR